MQFCLRTFAVVAALALAIPSAAHAQSRTTSAIRGFVTAQDGSILVGGTVVIRHDETGASRSGLTNANGAFLVLLLQPGGPYSVSIQHLGYSEGRVEGIRLAVGETFTMEYVMQEQAVELQGIDVAVERATIFTPTQIGPATRLTERVLDATPIMSRDVMELAVLSPLVKTTEGGGFSVAGQNDRYNAILVDGLASKDMFGLTSGGVPGGQAGAKLIPIDAVAQYEVLVAPFDVRLSGFTGGVMNAVTRSGTNDWRVRIGGVHRAEQLMGDLQLPTGPVAASGVDRSLLSFSVGGPVVLDKGHFFVAAEFERRNQPPSGYNLFRDPESLVRISGESMDEFASLMQTDHGVDVGNAAAYPLSQQLSNVFVRSDWNFDNGTRLTLRNVFSHATNDESPNRSAFLPYELSSNTVQRTSMNNITSLQLFSPLGDRFSNEFDMTVQISSDESAPTTDWPQVEVDVRSSIGDVSLNRPVRVGGQFFAQDNGLDQTSIRATNSLDIRSEGDDVVTLGITGSYYDIAHRFLPGAAGEYYFPSMADLRANAPERYQRAELAPGQDPAAKFEVVEVGAFVQHLMNAGKGLTMRFGIRMDAPYVLSSPEQNTDVLDFFGYDTSKLPSGNFLFSPRFGFNWQSDGLRVTQVRGGFGWFAGQVPYVWLSNAFHNNGIRSTTLTCSGRHYVEPLPARPAPPLNVGSQPAGCYDPDGGTIPFNRVSSVVMFEDGFKYPQDLKFSASVDHELSDRTSFTIGFLFNKALNQVGIEERNLEGGNTSLSQLGGSERKYYSDITSEFDQVLLVTNEGEDWATSLSLELRGQLTDRIGIQSGYAFARSWDRTSLTFADMASNFGFNPSEFDVNQPPLRTSNFDRPHKIVLAMYGAPFESLPDTELSLLYTGQSGLPFSYVYDGDVNGDGYPGVGGALDRFNDLVHVPATLSGLGEGAPYSLVTQILLADAIKNNDCLKKYAGTLVARNGCRAPWENRLDLRLAHTVHMGDRDIRFEGDLINVLNMVNGSWGKIETTSPVVPLLELCELGCESPLPARWGGAVLPQRNEDGQLTSPDPWTVITPDSQWQMQFGVRVTFGGGR
ncbi:MAG: TonB-dependent receptor [Gemmatimonadales bacterium]|nr:TonB-dependent receptor [Gemmatimonadales bacterium]MBT6694671.1 TonB-dependent receptor [Gemmatimonadales bacterium]